MIRRETMMPATVRERLLRVRIASKTGRPISPEDHAFSLDCFKRWPLTYSAMEPEVFDAAAMTVNPLWHPRAKKASR
jgi:hypothetical protein